MTFFLLWLQFNEESGALNVTLHVREVSVERTDRGVH